MDVGAIILQGRPTPGPVPAVMTQVVNGTGDILWVRQTLSNNCVQSSPDEQRVFACAASVIVTVLYGGLAASFGQCLLVCQPTAWLAGQH